ncbi:unnamed protein product [Caenorhabditis angaria]|uniref:Transthyretin-like family protein n=1 Tax=Caenorhabditis angaria TaxID=860376 RepID=A0A9P1IFG5_9PELO|nr:unnamed protein product [Caenorhabditis angaria]
MIFAILPIFLLISLTSSTEFFIQGSMRCNLNSNFEATVELWEEDSLESGWDLMKSKNLGVRASNVSHNFNIRGTQDEGDGIFDDEYEPLLRIYHNCMSRPGTGNILRRFKSVPITTPAVNFTGLTFKLDDRMDVDYASI